MTKATDNKHGTDFLFPRYEMTAFNGDMFSAYAQAGQAMLKSAVALNEEMMRFANERLQADAQTLQELQKCTCWEEAVTVQSDFARSATEAYSAEMPKLTEQASRTCTAAVAALLESAKILPEAATLSKAAKKP